MPSNVMQSEEYDAICAVLENKGDLLSTRLRALLATLRGTGLRVSEALDLTIEDLDFDDMVVRVRRGKGGKARVSAIREQFVGPLREWLELRRNLPGDKVFCTASGGRWAADNVRQCFRRLRARAGVDKRLHPHMMRHTHAYELAGQRLPLNVIQKQLGHSNLNTTQIYIDHLRPKDLADQIRGL